MRRQIARMLGAEVTGVCSTINVDFVKSIGAAHVIDYIRADFTRGDQRYDVMLDNAGNHSLAECRRVLTTGGTLIYNSGRAGFLPIIQLHVLKPFVRERLRFFVAKLNDADLDTLRDLIESGQLTPVIDRTYPLSEASEAVAHVGTGHARGKVVITQPG